MKRMERNWEEDKTVQLIDNMRVWKQNHSFSGKLSRRIRNQLEEWDVGDGVKCSSAQERSAESGAKSLQARRLART
jgi:hypothetical protein